MYSALQYPEGYLAAKKAGSKRGRELSDDCTPLPKLPRYDFTKHQEMLIGLDTVNKKLWEELLDSIKSLGTVCEDNGVYLHYFIIQYVHV